MLRRWFIVGLAVLIVSLAPGVRAGVVEDLARANRAHDRGRYATAEKILTRIIKADQLAAPYMAVVHYNRGNAFLAQGRKGRALADYNKAVKLAPAMALALYNRGNLLRQMGDLNRALDDFSQVCRLAPANPRGWNNRGEVLLFMDRGTEAMPFLLKAHKLDPKNPSILMNLAQGYKMAGKGKKALAALNRALPLAAGKKLELAVYLNRGLVWASLRQYDLAVRDFSLVISRDAKNSRALYNRALSFLKLERAQAAEADAKCFAELSPGNPLASRLLKKVARLKVRRQKGGVVPAPGLNRSMALAAVRGAVSREPTIKLSPRRLRLRPHQLAERALRAHRAGNPDRAFDLYTLALAKPGLPSWFKARLVNNRAVIIASRGDLVRSRGEVYRALRLDPALAEAHLNQGVLLSRAGMLLRALSAYGRAIALNPAMAKAYNNRGYILESLGSLKWALADYQEALRLEPSLAEAVFSRAMLLCRLGRLKEARRGLRQYLAMRPGSHAARGALREVKKLMAGSTPAE